jgi:hypothetical protein
MTETAWDDHSQNGGAEPESITARAEQFRREIVAMRLRDRTTGRERMLSLLGLVVAAVGVSVGISAYVLSHTTNNPLAQGDAITVGLLGVSVTGVGVALFLRYSIAQFLRFWLARLIYEQHAQTDRVVEALATERERRH